MDEERRAVVIGTGPAGAAAAWTLHRAGIAVTILEAGSERSALGLTVRTRELTVFRLRRHLAHPPRLAPGVAPTPDWYVDLAAGGLSNHWTCAVPRFAPEDLSDGERLGEQHRWPLSYEELGAHYPEMERLLQISGGGYDVPNLPGGEVSDPATLAPDWQPIVEQAAARGHGVAPLPLAYSGRWTATASGTPFNSYSRMLAGLPRSPRFQIVFSARALRLEWSGEHKRVTRVIYRDARGAEVALPATVVVVAAGALNSTRLLLASTSPDFPAGLGNTEDVLGRYLHDHPLAHVGFDTRKVLSIHPPSYVTRGPYQGSEPLSGVASVLWSNTGMRVRRALLPGGGSSHAIGFNLFGTVAPERDHRVSLAANQDDGSGVAGLRIELSFSPQTIATIEQARDRLAEILESAGVCPTRTHWELRNVGSSVHYGGTVRMHASPRYGMLDGRCRLHAVPNVLVVDSSAFTTGPEKNPTLTSMALAARACSLLARDLRS